VLSFIFIFIVHTSTPAVSESIGRGLFGCADSEIVQHFIRLLFILNRKVQELSAKKTSDLTGFIKYPPFCKHFFKKFSSPTKNLKIPTSTPILTSNFLRPISRYEKK